MYKCLLIIVPAPAKLKLPFHMFLTDWHTCITRQNKPFVIRQEWVYYYCLYFDLKMFTYSGATTLNIIHITEQWNKLYKM